MSYTHKRINSKGRLKSLHKFSKGELLTQKVRRIVKENEAIEDGAPMIYTERGEGVKPEYNVRTDRFEIAADAMDQVHRGKLARSKAAGETAKQKAENDAKAKENIESPQSGEGKNEV